MFAIQDFASVKLTNINPRIEKHGTESVPAVDMNFTLTAANSVLEQFHPDLLMALYAEPDEDGDDAEQEELDGVEPISAFTVLRFPKINPLKWESKIPGYDLTIDYGLGGKSCIEIEGCEVGKFVLDCMEGGTVEVKFQVQASSGLTEKIMGKLSLMIGQEVQIKLDPPQVDEPQQITGAGEQRSAEDIFAQDSQPAAVH